MGAQNDHMTITKLFFKRHADVNWPMEIGATPSVYGAHAAYMEITHVLITGHADVNLICKME